ncbi:MAG: spore coat associated protein CotJA [Ruminococcaceae bacterium]|nr:spore coat associated protein CotJA [Oscillospiraceae bacterium]
MPEKPVYGIAYVPYSRFEDVYPVEKAIDRGTMFKKLDIPFSTYANISIMNPFC